MRSQLESMLRGHRVLNRFQLRGEKLNDLSALRTDHVIVVLMFVVMFVMRAAIAEPHFARQAGVRQKPERSVDRRLAHARILFAHETVKIFTGNVAFASQKDVENQIALGCTLQTALLNVFLKYFLLFSH